MLCFSKFLKQRNGISTAKARRIGVQIISGISVKWKVLNSLAVMARTPIPTARALTIYETISIFRNWPLVMPTD